MLKGLVTNRCWFFMCSGLPNNRILLQSIIQHVRYETSITPSICQEETYWVVISTCSAFQSRCQLLRQVLFLSSRRWSSDVINHHQFAVVPWSSNVIHHHQFVVVPAVRTPQLAACPSKVNSVVKTQGTQGYCLFHHLPYLVLNNPGKVNTQTRTLIKMW